jgi:tetratricopeptide (TPR) repeat protein
MKHSNAIPDPKTFVKDLQESLRDYPVLLLFSVKDHKLNLLIEYPSDFNGQTEELKQAITARVEHYPAIQDIQQVILYGRTSGQKVPQWQHRIQGSALQEPSPHPSSRTSLSYTTLTGSTQASATSLSLSLTGTSGDSKSFPFSKETAKPVYSKDQDSSSQQAEQPLLSSRYRIKEVLAKGGFGKTYLAEDTHRPGNPICVVKQLQLKSPKPELLEMARNFFNLEAETLEELGRHDQIPQLLAYFEQGGEFFLVQEYIKGPTLKQELSKGVFNEKKVIELLRDVLQILDFIHQRQVIHRDLKPGNLIRREKDQKLILIDFGAVKQKIQGDSEGGVAVGTNGYVPPEQWQSNPQFNSDIFALGMVAIQCLTGIHPTKLPKDEETELPIWKDKVKISQALATILDRMTDPDFKQRYPSAAEVLLELDYYFGSASKPLWQTWLHYLRRPKVAMAVGLGSLGLGMILVGGSYWKFSHDAYQSRQGFYNGILLAEGEQWQEAKESYLEALQKNRLYDPARVALQYSETQIKNIKAKISQQRQALVAQAKDPELRKSLGIHLYQIGDLDAAISELNTSAVFNSNDPEVYYYLGQAHAQREEWETAKGYFERALRLQPTYVWALIHLGLAHQRTNNSAAALESLRIATELSMNHPSAHYYLGSVFADQKQWDQAIDSYLKALALNPLYRQMRQDLGYGLYSPEHLPQAIRHYQKKLAENPKNASYFYRLGNAFLADNKLPEAAQAYQKGLEQNPRDVQLLVCLGQIQLTQKDVDLAAETFTKALAANSQSSEAHRGMGRVFLEKSKQDPALLPQALNHFKTSVQLAPRNADAHFQLGIALLQHQELEQAQASLQQAIQLNPRNPEIRFYLGYALAQLGRSSEASNQFSFGLKSNPADAALSYALAGTLAIQGKTQEALKWLEASVLVETSQPTTASPDRADLQEEAKAFTSKQIYKGVSKKTQSPPPSSLAGSATPAAVNNSPPASVSKNTPPTSVSAKNTLDQVVKEKLAEPEQIKDLKKVEPASSLSSSLELLLQSISLALIVLLSGALLMAIGGGVYLMVDATTGILNRKKGRKLSGDPAQKHLLRGMELYHKNDWEEAIAEFRAALQFDRALAKAYFYRGQCYLKQNQLQRAIDEFWLVNGLEPTFTGMPDTLISTLLTYGNQLYDAGNLDQAVDQYLTATRIAGDTRLLNAELHYRAGLAFSKKSTPEAWEQAISHLQKAIQLSSGLADAYYTLGVVYNLKRDSENALPAFERVVSLDPQRIEARYQFGIALYRQGHLREALTHFRSTLTAKPDLYLIRADIGFALFQAGDLNAAETEFKHLLARDSSSAMGLLGLAMIAYGRRMYEEAEQCCEKALKQTPDLAEAIALLGLIHLASKKISSKGGTSIKNRTIELAQVKFETAIKLDRYVPEAHFGLGEIARIRRHYAFAVESYKTALRANRSYAAAHFRLATVYLDLRNYTAAISALQETLRIHPSYPDAAALLAKSLAGQERHENDTIIQL